MQWDKIYGPDVQYSDRYFHSFQQSSDGGFIAAGSTNEFNGGSGQRRPLLRCRQPNPIQRTACSHKRVFVAAPIQTRTWAHSEWCAGWDSLSDRPRTARRSSTRRPLTIPKKPFDNIEVLQLASALTEKWRVAEVARRRVQDLETLVELSTDALQRSNARLADANEQLALQTERADKNAAAANPTT